MTSSFVESICHLRMFYQRPVSPLKPPLVSVDLDGATLLVHLDVGILLGDLPISTHTHHEVHTHKCFSFCLERIIYLYVQVQANIHTGPVTWDFPPQLCGGPSQALASSQHQPSPREAWTVTHIIYIYICQYQQKPTSANQHYLGSLLSARGKCRRSTI